MRWQNTDIAWNEMMEQADVMLLHTDVTLLRRIHTRMISFFSLDDQSELNVVWM